MSSWSACNTHCYYSQPDMVLNQFIYYDSSTSLLSHIFSSKRANRALWWSRFCALESIKALPLNTSTYYLCNKRKKDKDDGYFCVYFLTSQLFNKSVTFWGLISQVRPFTSPRTSRSINWFSYILTCPGLRRLITLAAPGHSFPPSCAIYYRFYEGILFCFFEMGNSNHSHYSLHISIPDDAFF